MGAAVSLTNRVVADLKLPKGRTVYVHDSGVRGFCVSVTPKGAKSFYWYGRTLGRPRRIRIGTFPEMNVTDARQCARSIGGDAASGKAVGDRKRTGRLTIDDLFAHWALVHAKQQRGWKRWERDYENLLKPELGTAPLPLVTRDEVRRVLGRIADRHSRSAAHRVHTLLSSMFNVGVEDKWCDSNPVRGIPRPAFDARTRYLKREEVAAFLAAIDQLRNEDARDYFRLCLCTGQRRSNVSAMRWDELDVGGGLWIVPASKSKNKKPLTVPLTSQATAIIERRRGNGSPWVFPSDRRPGEHYCDSKSAWQRVRELSGLDDLKLHDLRRSFGHYQLEAGANLKTVSESLGHSDVRVTAKHYTPISVSQVRASTQAAVDALMGAGK